MAVFVTVRWIRIPLADLPAVMAFVPEYYLIYKQPCIPLMAFDTTNPPSPMNVPGIGVYFPVQYFNLEVFPEDDIFRLPPDMRDRILWDRRGPNFFLLPDYVVRPFLPYQPLPQAPRWERSLYLVFTQGGSISENQIKQFFESGFGDDVVLRVEMQRAERPKHAWVVFASVHTVNCVLRGQQEVYLQVTSDNVVWARRKLSPAQKAERIQKNTSVLHLNFKTHQEPLTEQDLSEFFTGAFQVGVERVELQRVEPGKTPWWACVVLDSPASVNAVMLEEEGERAFKVLSRDVFVSRYRNK